MDTNLITGLLVSNTGQDPAGGSGVGGGAGGRGDGGGWGLGGGLSTYLTLDPIQPPSMSLYNYHRTHHRNCYPANGVYVGFHRDIYHVSSPFLRGGGECVS